LLSIDEEFRAIEMTIVRSPFLLDFADALLDEAPDFSEDVLRQWEEDKTEIFGERWPEVTRILAALQAFGVYLLVLIQAIFPFLKRLGETKSEIVSKQRLTEAWLQGLLILGDHEPFNRLALNESIHNLRDVGDRDASVKKVIGFD
jgi:hypothetical protein